MGAGRVYMSVDMQSASGKQVMELGSISDANGPGPDTYTTTQHQHERSQVKYATRELRHESNIWRVNRRRESNG